MIGPNFSDFEYRQALKKLRIFLISNCLCCVTFYFFMTRIDVTHKDFIPGRVTVCAFAILGFLATFVVKKNRIQWAQSFLRLTGLSFLFLYLYLLQINDWSLFYCWSYFIVGAILCSSSTTMAAFLTYSLLGVICPLALGFFSPLSALELWHFHSANIVTFSLIGISVAANVTYKKSVAKLTNDLIEQSKMAALGEMAGGISHEINNPLAIIKGANEQLKRVTLANTSDKEKFDNLSDKISRMVLRITEITSGLKEFSQDASDQELELHDLNGIIEDGIRLCMRKFKNSETSIAFEPVEEQSLCLCKKNQIVQIILNLCTNSFEATKDTPSPSIKVTLRNDQHGFYQISVIDNGAGVAEEIANKVMEPFFTTKEIGSKGLGLSVAHGFAKVHGGDLNLEKGKQVTRFTLKLPVPSLEDYQL